MRNKGTINVQTTRLDVVEFARLGRIERNAQEIVKSSQKVREHEEFFELSEASGQRKLALGPKQGLQVAFQNFRSR